MSLKADPSPCQRVLMASMLLFFTRVTPIGHLTMRYVDVVVVVVVVVAVVEVAVVVVVVVEGQGCILP